MILDLDETIDILREWAESKAEVIALAIFGSYARGEQDKNSDLDIAVLLTDPSGKDTSLTIWICESDNWQEEISSLLQFPKIHLHLYEGDKMPPIKQGLQKAKILVYKAELDNEP